jgi:ADP-heptose:LPS heptosyltransferase
MILIAPWSKQLRNGSPNPKNYPHWHDLVKLLPSPVVQVGVDGELQLVEDFRKNLNLKDLAQIIQSCSTWISVDTFFQHYAWSLGKKGVVIWGQSDPKIYGHEENINLLLDRSYLTPNQFLMWEMIPYRDDCWVDPKTVLQHVLKLV